MLQILSKLWRYRARATGLVLCAQALGAVAQVEADVVQVGQRWLESTVAQVSPAASANGMALRMEVAVGALDARLRLSPCAKVEPFVPQGTRLWGRSRVGLRCLDGATRWSVFLPVTVKAFGPAWVAKNNINAGAVLMPDDAMEAEVDWAEDASPVVALPEQWIGQVATRSWAAGQAIRQSMVRAPQVFQAGTQIRVLAQGPGFQVTSDGQAMTAGVVGQPARVRMESGRVMSGVVQDARTIRVDM
ncbi:flagella basal body P-ring formation protein FlgA [Rhodoferax sp. OV413]|uniref:flagellar basal body P-ring formation chaperone FlgA n=1 Tax=Rhodoferax sp. OV413 TaxID=1855285 RepID=UPI00088335D1|nr:flagellar basal body P-ring formation chaperone FlgA [Rhodoferax sp. OV413]SDP93468.1 flagella basal body P-ring formation protein FlgA [Rhodoferax sp. OV413]